MEMEANGLPSPPSGATSISTPVVAPPARVRVGVGCFVQHSSDPSLFLVGRRKGSHGEGKCALPGGHLELGESWEECAGREVAEETNLSLENLRFAAVSNSPNMDGDPNKHYVTIFMVGVAKDISLLANLEPHKCEGWEWMTWAEMVNLKDKTLHLLFEPLVNLMMTNPERPF